MHVTEAPRVIAQMQVADREIDEVSERESLKGGRFGAASADPSLRSG
jgi:hypothetical protein